MRIFISYSHMDKSVCRELADDILRPIPYDVWFDTSLAGGDNWWQMILSEIDKCDVFIYLLSNESISSKWCQEEYKTAVEAKKQILPLLFRRITVDLPDDSLKNIQYIDMQYGLRDAKTIVELFKGLIRIERELYLQSIVTNTSLVNHRVPKQQKKQSRDFYYNFMVNFERSKNKENTKRAYARHICSFIDWLNGTNTKRTVDEQYKYLSSLSLRMLQEELTEHNIRLWLQHLNANGLTSLVQPIYAIRLLVNLLAEDNHIGERVVNEINKIEFIGLTNDDAGYRILNKQELKSLLFKVERDASRPLEMRNAALVTLCLVVRSGDIHILKWKHIQNDYVLLNGEWVKLPTVAIRCLGKWRQELERKSANCTSPEQNIIVRFRGGNIYGEGITNDSVLRAVRQSAENAGFDNINPESLRLSFNHLRENADPTSEFDENLD